MKFARHCCQLLLLALLSPTVALALGLGDIHLKSSLDAPLDADIDLVDADVEDLVSLKATLASRDTFKRLGADYPSFLGQLTLTPERTPDGHAYIHVHSAGVADEPAATLLVEVDWARGHLVREYTVLLDPPVYNSQARTNPSVAAPAAGATERSGSVEHPAPSAANTEDKSTSAAAAAATAADNSAAATGSSNGSAAPGAAGAPPAADQAANASSSSAATASSGAGATAGAAQSSAPAASAAASTPAAQASADNAASAPAAGTAPGSYTVRSGDTLSSIAAQTYGGDHAKQMRALVAIYHANPSAFRDNMNVLYSGRVLKLPGDSEIEAIGPGEAVTEVRQQYASWRDGHGSERVANAGPGGRGQLRLVAPQEGAEPSTPAASAPSAAQGASGAGNGAGTAALQQRVQQLESQLAESQRLLQMRNAELAALQARVQQQAAGRPSGAGPTAGAPPQPATAPAVTSIPTPAPIAATPAPTPPAANAPSASPAVTPPVRPRAATPPQRPRTAARPAPSNSMLDLLAQYWYAVAGLIAVLIIVLAMRWMRSRQEIAFDRSLGELAQPAAEPELPVRNDTVPVRTMTGTRQEPSYHVEESGTHLRPTFDLPPSPPEHEAVVEESAPAEAPVALDQGDPLAEADFHMAYGLYDQAAELVQIAISREPKRRDLKMKLLEVFFVWGNRERFLQSAHELAQSRDQAPAGEWEKILIMGRQIAPEDALFADSRGLAGAGKVVDLNLEGGQNRVDFDLLGEPSLGSASQESAVELDLGAALGEPSASEATGEAPQMGGRDMDYVLDEAEHGGDATGTTREMPGAAPSATDMTALRPAHSGAGSTETLRVVIGEETEAPTVEQPQLRGGDHGTIRQKIDAAARANMAAGEQTAELAIDDLGLDLGALEGHTDENAMPVDSEAPTLLADLDEDTRRMLETAESQQVRSTEATQRAPAVAAGGMRPNATGTWMFTDTDFAQIAPTAKPSPTQVITQINPQLQIDTGSTAVARSAARSGGLDLDLGSLESLKAQNGNGLDLDVGAAAGASSDTAYVDTQRLGKNAVVSDDMSLPDLEPVTLSEVGTKLDLARAYMDMGDPEGARSILSEVMSEGSMSQKQEARRLMEALPG